MARSNEHALTDLVGIRFPVLDKGHVILLDVMGSDEDIAAAARTSFGKGTRKVSEDETLIRYLMRHRHTTPFEMAEIKIHVRVPMDTWRQWIRHRTASVNEYSTRYSEAIDAKQETAPEDWRLQSTANKQGSGGFVEDWPDLQMKRECEEAYASPGCYLTSAEQFFHVAARELYEERLKFGVAREQARKDLPLSTYTEAVWKCDLKNTLGFLSLRMDSHAQLEIRQYANVIGNEIVAKLFPQTWQAFLDYQLNAVTLSAIELEVLGRLQKGDNSFSTIKNQRERDECIAKLERIGLY